MIRRLAVLAALLAAHFVHAQGADGSAPPTPPAGGKLQDHDGSQIAAILNQKLALTEAQRPPLLAIVRDYVKKEGAIIRDRTLTDEVTMAKRKSLAEVTNAQIMAILNDDQKAIFSTLLITPGPFHRKPQ